VGHVCDKQLRDVFSTITLDWRGIVGGYNTADTVVRDRRMYVTNKEEKCRTTTEKVRCGIVREFTPFGFKIR